MAFDWLNDIVDLCSSCTGLAWLLIGDELDRDGLASDSATFGADHDMAVG